jgi:hypothetical protein
MAAVDLADFVETLRREVSPPGVDNFATATDDDMTGYLSDAFWEARLDGFCKAYTCDIAGLVTPVDPTNTVDFPRDQTALVVLYAGIKILRNKLMTTQTRFTAKAGPVEFTSETGSNVLTNMLTTLKEVKDRLVELNTQFGSVSLIDGLSARAASPASYSGYLYDWYIQAFGTPDYGLGSF